MNLIIESIREQKKIYEQKIVWKKRNNSNEWRGNTFFYILRKGVKVRSL